jgi:EAL domain-containing protein (putative c-di-GMP-specific phosphodiesterase class I)
VRQLRSGGLAGQVREALRASGLPPGSLLIEIPETAVRQLSEPITQALSEITASGAQLSIDDFGTGYASLPTLQRLRASAVCIDRTLIEGVPREGERAALARALIALARGLEFDVVAKGVETKAQRDFLAEAGCRICQGELFAPARPAHEVEPFLRARLAA